MYGQSSLLIAGVLLVAMMGVIEVGYRVGLRNHVRVTEPTKTHINAIQASTLGVLALLLGFTFSLALQRHDSRSVAVVEEANAIGTAFLRADLLPASVRSSAQEALRRYLDLRVRSGQVSLSDTQRRDALLQEANSSQQELWGYALQAAREDPNPVTTGLFIQSMNDLIDAYGTRNAALERHVPEVVLYLLFATFLITASLVGYASGVGGQRTPLATYFLVVLIVVLVFIIIDLDRPRRGLIEVNQSSLVELRASVFGQLPLTLGNPSN